MHGVIDDVCWTCTLLQNTRMTPFAHQVVGTLRFIEHPYFFNTDEMGAGKTKQAIDAAFLLWLQGKITSVIVLAPASVKGVWFNKDFGQLSRHAWTTTGHVHINEYHSRLRSWTLLGADTNNWLDWTISNYEFIRVEERLKPLLKTAGPKTLLILDESSAVKNHKAAQTKAVIKLRKKCGYVWMLNGTPIAHSPLDLFSQGNILHPSILDCPYVTYFKARYAIQQRLDLKDRTVDVITGWTNLDDLQKRFAPYVIRRLKKDCLDLPAKLPPVVLEATLTDKTWAVYKEMRDEMVAWIKTAVWTAPHAITQMLRLAQITSGFLSGQREILDPADLPFDLPEDHTDQETRDIGREKLDAFLEWHRLRLEADPNFKLLVWCWFRYEIERIVEELRKIREMNTGVIWGGQKRWERDQAEHLLTPESMPPGPVTVVGTPSSGGMGLTLVGTNNVFYFSNDYNMKTRLQSEDRVHRPGQTHTVNYYDLVAVGPKGQKTINHRILAALHAREDIANWTTSHWVQALLEE